MQPPAAWRSSARGLTVSRTGAIGRERAKDILVLENLGARLALHELARRAAARGGPTDVRRAFCVSVEEFPAFVRDPAPFADVIDERAALEQLPQRARAAVVVRGHDPGSVDMAVARPS